MSLLIATPCYNGVSLAPFEASCYNLRKELVAAGIGHDFLRIANESLVTRARNVCAASFLFDTQYECLLFVDADIEFEPADVARIWNLCLDGADVAVGHYRHKKPSAPVAAWVGGQLTPLEKFTEPFEVDYAGTGFMMIRRKTFEKLIDKHPDWEYEEGMPLEGWVDKPPQKPCWAFFQDPIEDSPLGKFHLSEDYFFCSRVREAGMKVIMDPAVQLKHWGMYPY